MIFVQVQAICNCQLPPLPRNVWCPAGAVLGTLLFLVYMRDLPNSISSPIKLFVDDCAIYRQILDPDDRSALQSDLDYISSSYGTSLMKLNSTKCKSM